MNKPRPLSVLAKEAMDVQDACNLSGVVHGFSRAITELRSYYDSTWDINTHPISVMWASKIASLTHCETGLALSDAMAWCEKVSKDES